MHQIFSTLVIDTYIDCHSRVNLMDSAQIRYAWNSWSYHGERAGDSGFMDIVEKLCHYDKTLWVEPFPDHYHHLCMDGLDAGIAWLQVSNVFLCELRVIIDRPR